MPHARARRALITTLSIAALGAATPATALADPIGPPISVADQNNVMSLQMAHAGSTNRHLAVWQATNDGLSGEPQILARMLNPAAAVETAVIEISGKDPINGPPAAAYNPKADEFLVVWSHQRTNEGVGEMWGQRVRNASGKLIGDRFQISEMALGTEADPSIKAGALWSDVLYDPDRDQYVVAFAGQQTAAAKQASGSKGPDRSEIYARRIKPNGRVIDRADVLVSRAELNLSQRNRAIDPRIEYSPTNGEYLIVYTAEGKDENPRVHAQRLTQSLEKVGTEFVAVADDPASLLWDADIDYNPVTKQFMVAWAKAYAGNIYRIHARVLDSSGTPVSPEILVSTSPPAPNFIYFGYTVSIEANERASEFAVSWNGYAPGGHETFVQRIGGDGALIGTPAVQASAVGPKDISLAAPELSYAPERNEYVVGWYTADRAQIDASFEDDGPAVDKIPSPIFVRRHGASPATVPVGPACTSVSPGPVPGPQRSVTSITSRQLKINQAIGAAAIRRANAIEERLNLKLGSLDICGGSLGKDDFHSSVSVTEQPSFGFRQVPSPARLAVPKATAKPGVTFRVSRQQLCINQRVYQRAIAQAAALDKRIRGGLTGGDIVDGALTRGNLSKGIQIVGTTPGTVIPPSTTTFEKPKQKGCQNVKVTAAQAAINARIAIAAVDRVNALRTILETGLTGENFADGSIAASDLKQPVIP